MGPSESGPVLNADPEMQMQINYPPHHRDRFVQFLSLLHACMLACCLHILYSWTKSRRACLLHTTTTPRLSWVEPPAPAGPVAKVEFEDSPPPSLFSSSHCCLGRASSCTPWLWRVGTLCDELVSICQAVLGCFGLGRIDRHTHNALAAWAVVTWAVFGPPGNAAMGLSDCDHLTFHRNISARWIGVKALSLARRGLNHFRLDW